MSLKSWLGQMIRDLAATPPAPRPPKSPESTPGTTTQRSRTSNETSEVVGLVMNQMREMQKENLAQIRGMVLDMIQGREQSQTFSTPDPATSIGRQQFDPPDYDDPSNDPAWMSGVDERENREIEELRQLNTERDVLLQQLENGRAQAGIDPQGPIPTSGPSFSGEWATADSEYPPMPRGH